MNKSVVFDHIINICSKEGYAMSAADAANELCVPCTPAFVAAWHQAVYKAFGVCLWIKF
jgi:hypothetical protein